MDLVDDLFTHAARLATNGKSQGTEQIDFRRAVSAAYYAVFHLLTIWEAMRYRTIRRRPIHSPPWQRNLLRCSRTGTVPITIILESGHTRRSRTSLPGRTTSTWNGTPSAGLHWRNRSSSTCLEESDLSKTRRSPFHRPAQRPATPAVLRALGDCQSLECRPSHCLRVVDDTGASSVAFPPVKFNFVVYNRQKVGLSILSSNPTTVDGR